LCDALISPIMPKGMAFGCRDTENGAQ